MKRNGFFIGVFCAALLFALGFAGREAECAETQIFPSDTMEAGPVMNVGEEYYAQTDGFGYVSFVTPSEEGYVVVEYKNISISGWAYGKVYSSIGEELASNDNYMGNSCTFTFKSEVGGRNEAGMATGTKYYIRVGKDGSAGNVKLAVQFRKDDNPDGKECAEQVRLNTLYTRSIDVGTNGVQDYDYFKFTASSSGAHHFVINNACSSSYLYYSIRKWTSDEYVKKTNGYDMNDSTYYGNSAEYDISLEAGETYYLTVWGKSIGNYTFYLSNQSITSISMTSGVTLAPGETYTLSPTISPSGAYNKVISYSSSDTSVAYVNSSTGEIKAYRAGKAVITATATDGSGTAATCTVYVVPSKPGAPYCSASTTSAIKLSWSSVSGVSGYVLYRKSGSKWVSVAATTNTSYTVKKLKAGTGYQFKLRAYVNADGRKYSSYSNTGSYATLPAKTSISKITKLSRKKSGVGYYYRAKVTWKKSSGATSYKLYRRVKGSSYKSLVGTYKGTGATTKLYYSKYSSASRQYTFYVVPVKTYGGETYTGAYSKGKSYKYK